MSVLGRGIAIEAHEREAPGVTADPEPLLALLRRRDADDAPDSAPRFGGLAREDERRVGEGLVCAQTGRIGKLAYVRRRRPVLAGGAPIPPRGERRARLLRQAGRDRAKTSRKRTIAQGEERASGFPEGRLDEEHVTARAEGQRGDKSVAIRLGDLGEDVREHYHVERTARGLRHGSVAAQRPQRRGAGEGTSLGQSGLARIERHRLAAERVEERERRRRRSGAHVEDPGTARKIRHEPQHGLYLRVRLRPPPQQIRSEMGALAVRRDIRKVAASHEAFVERLDGHRRAPDLRGREPIGRSTRKSEERSRPREERGNAGGEVHRGENNLPDQTIPSIRRASAKSSGSGASHAILTPVTGCGNARVAACSACRPSACAATRAGSSRKRRASRRTPPYRTSPRSGHPASERWARIWCVRPVCNSTSRSATEAARPRTWNEVTARRPSRTFEENRFRSTGCRPKNVSSVCSAGGLPCTSAR